MWNHLAVEEGGKDILGIEVNTADWGDSEILPDLLGQIEGEIAQVSANGSYDGLLPRHTGIRPGRQITACCIRIDEKRGSACQ